MPTNQSTQQLVEIADIKDQLVLLKDGSLRSVIEISAINFELRSEPEQVAILQNFQNFLNSIDFPLQIVMNSRQLNMNEYLKLVDSTADSIQSELLKIQALEYSKFIRELLQLSNIMSKKFYVVIPFYAFETPDKTGLIQSFKSMVGSKSKNMTITNEQIETYRTQLLQRAELIFDGLIGLGLKARLLEKDELVSLFYTIYNPGGELKAKEFLTQ